MKTKNNYLKFFTLCLGLLVAVSCSDDEVIEPPLAFYTAEVSADDNLTWTFTNESLEADSYAWDFGDETGTSTDASPTYTYAAPGTYTVVLTATNGGGTNSYEESIVVLANDPVNLIVNGELDDDSNWTIIQHNANDNGSITFADGVAVYNEISDVAEGGWGDIWAHVGMYQAVEVEAGTYMLDLEIVTEGINETWLEVWIGANEPVVGEDYNGDNGASRALMANAWDCDGTRTYTGSLAETGCGGHDGTFTFDAEGTYYVVIRGGGFNFGPNGISIDNITMFKQ